MRTVPLIDKELGRRYEPDYFGFSSWRRDADTSSTAEAADQPSANATHSLPSDSRVAQPSFSVAPPAQSAQSTPPAPQSPSQNAAAATTTSSQQQPAAKPPAPPAPSQQAMPQPADTSPPPQQTFPTPPPREEIYKVPPEGDDILGIFRPPPANLKRDPRYAPVWHQPSRSFTDG